MKMRILGVAMAVATLALSSAWGEARAEESIGPVFALKERRAALRAKLKECRAAARTHADNASRREALKSCRVELKEQIFALRTQQKHVRKLVRNEKEIGDWLATCARSASPEAKSRCVEEHGLRLAWLRQLLADAQERLGSERQSNEEKARACDDGVDHLKRWEDAAKEWWQKLNAYAKRGGISPGWLPPSEPEVCPQPVEEGCGCVGN
jgi:hypothetical protein